MAKKAVKGKVICEKGKYYLEVAGKKEELPVGLLTDEAFLKGQVDQEVDVFYSTPKSFVAAIRPKKGPGIITCNLVMDVLRGETFITNPSPVMVSKVAAKLLEDGFISKEVHDKIRKSAG